MATVRHIVALKFKEDTAAADVDALLANLVSVALAPPGRCSWRCQTCSKMREHIHKRRLPLATRTATS